MTAMHLPRPLLLLLPALLFAGAGIALFSRVKR